MSTTKERVFRQYANNKFYLDLSIFTSPDLVKIISEVISWNKNIAFFIDNNTLAVFKSLSQEAQNVLFQLLSNKIISVISYIAKEDTERTILFYCSKEDIENCPLEQKAQKSFYKSYVVKKPSGSNYYDLEEINEAGLFRFVIRLKGHYEDLQKLTIWVEQEEYIFNQETKNKIRHFDVQLPKMEQAYSGILRGSRYQDTYALNFSADDIPLDGIPQMEIVGQKGKEKDQNDTSYQLQVYRPTKIKKKAAAFQLFSDQPGLEKGHEMPIPERLQDYCKNPEGQIQLQAEGNRHYTLKEKLNSGGEGAVFSLEEDSRLVAKIYSGKVYYSLEQKLRKMISCKSLAGNTNIAFPQHILFYNGHFVGYVMPKVVGEPLHILNYKNLKQQYSNFKRSDLVWIAQNYLKILQVVHASGILLVDINEGNILLEPESKMLSLVDIDSAQVEKFPCHVGVEEFISAKMLGKRRESQTTNKVWLSSLEDELFSVSVFIFMILMGGQHPYNYKGRSSEAPVKANEEAHFVYPYAGNGDSSKIPGKSFAPFWDNFNDDMKELFHRIFRLKQTLQLTEMLEKLNEYEKFLQKNPQKNILFF